MSLSRGIRDRLNGLTTKAASNLTVALTLWTIWGICFFLAAPMFLMFFSIFGAALITSVFFGGVFGINMLEFNRPRWWAMLDASCALSSVLLLTLSFCGVSQDIFGTAFAVSVAVWLVVFTACEQGT